MRRLVAIVAVLAVCACALVGVNVGATNTITSSAESAPYVDYPSTDEVASYDFMHAEFKARLGLGNNTKLVFGSSELAPGGKGAAHPINLFRGKAYGLDLMTVGRAYCESFWQAMELGALADDVKATGDNRVVIFLSMQWFTWNRDTASDLSVSFSQGAYEKLMASDAYSDELKARITSRLADYGIDRTSGDTPVGTAATLVDAKAQLMQKKIRLAGSLSGLGSSSVDASGGLTDEQVNGGVSDDASTTPDWATLFAEGDAEARANCTTNDIGYYDVEWNKDEYNKFLAASATAATLSTDQLLVDQEFEDFQMLMDVCQQAGIKPLVIIQAVKGAAYDQTAYTADIRETYVQRVTSIAQAAGADVADFTCYDYDTYFSLDVSHPSALGSAYYSKCIYTWFNTGKVDVSAPEGLEL